MNVNECECIVAGCSDCNGVCSEARTAVVLVAKSMHTHAIVLVLYINIATIASLCCQQLKCPWVSPLAIAMQRMVLCGDSRAGAVGISFVLPARACAPWHICTCACRYACLARMHGATWAPRRGRIWAGARHMRRPPYPGAPRVSAAEAVAPAPLPPYCGCRAKLAPDIYFALYRPPPVDVPLRY